MASESNDTSQVGTTGIWQLVEKAAARVPGWVEQVAPRAASTRVADMQGKSKTEGGATEGQTAAS